MFFMIRAIFRLDTVRLYHLNYFNSSCTKDFLLELKYIMTARYTFESSLVILLSFLFRIIIGTSWYFRTLHIAGTEC